MKLALGNAVPMVLLHARSSQRRALFGSEVFILMVDWWQAIVSAIIMTIVLCVP